jgi:DmsE family decaheme c-type cytochrome
MNRRFILLLAVAVSSLLWAAGTSLTAEPVVSGRVVAAIAPRPINTAQPPATSQAAGANFVGDDTCAGCHETEGKTLPASMHGKSVNPRTPAAKTNQACETCHGPGREHAESGDKTKIRVFPAMAPSDATAVCLTCHNRGNHAGWEGSGHERRNLSCSTCHSVHSPKSAERQLVQPTQTQVCATCHRLQVTKTERSVAHMPVREGKMSCSSCHNPHGSISNVKNLKTGSSVAESCTSCHTEMRGPMLFEHAPVRENCATCHDPHGSSNDRMLAVRMPMLCQRCHIASKHPATLYDKDQITTNKSNRMFGRSCVNCHSQVHGSNHPSGQFFMR